MQIRRNLKIDFRDDRGIIQTLLDDGSTCIKSILFISSKKGAVRANHYHKEDSHYCYMLSGKMEYFERAITPNTASVERAILGAGDMVYSSSNVIHAMRFLEDSEWVVLSTKSRKDGNYEQDTVKSPII